MSFRTIRHLCVHEIPKIKRSRFLASIYPVQTSDEARAVLEAHAQQKQLKDASHHCYAWKFYSSVPTEAYSDDGEPSGSAGVRILHEIDQYQLHNVLLVVSRIYGGTKLGVGGLARAYGDAAKQLLECHSSSIIEHEPVQMLRLELPFHSIGAFESLCAKTKTQITCRTYFPTGLHVQVDVPAAQMTAFVSLLQQTCKGQAIIEDI